MSSTGRMKMTYTLHDGITVTSPTPEIPCRQFQYGVIRVTTTGTINVTLAVVASADTEIQTIDFGSASSATNPWFPVGVVNQDTTVPISGTSGIVLASAGTTSYTINADAFEYVGVIPTVNSGTGTVSVTLTLTENF